MLVGFHGYGETAGTQLDRLRAIPGSEEWLVVSIQGLHRYYQRRTNEVVASWMTRQDRELAIADNVAYVASVVETVGREYAATGTRVLAGFSQGVAMTFRAATQAPRPVAGVIAVGGDVPPEISPPVLMRVTSMLLCRGTRDEWYTAGKFGEDAQRIREAGVDLRTMEFDGGHEWSQEVIDAASSFLRERRHG